MLEGFLTNVLQKKWHTYLRLRFYIEVAVFACFFLLSGLTIFMKRIHFDWLVSNNYTNNSENGENELLEQNQCAYYKVTDNLFRVSRKKNTAFAI
jgi:hypothetical protein